MSMFRWQQVDPGPGEAVAPDQRLPWPKTIGVGAQHVVAMFGATFVFPLVMGLDPNLAIMFSGICTIMFLLIVSNAVPSYLGTSASFVASVAAIRADGGDSADVTGAIMVAGIVLALVGVLIHFAGSEIIHKILPPAVTGAVVMLIGFNLAPVVAGIYWPEDQWIALITATFLVVVAVMAKGFISRIAVFLALVFGYLISWLADRIFGSIDSAIAGSGGVESAHDRIWNWAAVENADWIGLPSGKLGRRRRRRARPEHLAHLRPARAARRDRPDRGEHRPRQGGRRDDRQGPRPLHGPGHRRRRVRHRLLQHVRWLAHDDVRREHRGHGCHPRLLDGRLLRGRDRRHPARARARSSGRWWPRHLAACSAASRLCCTG